MSVKFFSCSCKIISNVFVISIVTLSPKYISCILSIKLIAIYLLPLSIWHIIAGVTPTAFANSCWLIPLKTLFSFKFSPIVIFSPYTFLCLRVVIYSHYNMFVLIVQKTISIIYTILCIARILRNRTNSN